MRPLLVVTLEPFRSDLPDLLQRLEYVSIEDFRPIGKMKDEEFQTAKPGWATVRAGARRPKAPLKEPHLWVVGEGEVRCWAQWWPDSRSHFLPGVTFRRRGSAVEARWRVAIATVVR